MCSFSLVRLDISKVLSSSGSFLLADSFRVIPFEILYCGSLVADFLGISLSSFLIFYSIKPSNSFWLSTGEEDLPVLPPPPPPPPLPREVKLALCFTTYS